MKLSKRVNYKKVTKKGKNGKKRQSRKTNKKTQNGGLLDNQNNIVALLCETQTIVEKPRLSLRKTDNTGFFYVSQNTELPSTMDNTMKKGASTNLREGLVVKLIKDEFGKYSLLNNKVELPRTLQPVDEPLFSVRCGALKSNGIPKDSVRSDLTLDMLAKLISKNIIESIRKHTEEIPPSVGEEQKHNYIFERVLRELNTISGLEKIRQIEIETISFLTTEKEKFMEIVDSLRKLSNDNDANTSQNNNYPSLEKLLQNAIKLVLESETYNGPVESYSNLQENGFTNGKVKKLAEIFQRGGKQKGGLSPNFMKRILFPLFVGGLTALSVFTGGAMILPSLAAAACIYHKIGIEVRSEQISKWICKNLVNIDSPMNMNDSLDELSEFEFEGYSSKFKHCLNGIRDLIKLTIEQKFDRNLDIFSENALNYVDGIITNVDKLSQLSGHNLYAIKSNCRLFNKIYNEFVKKNRYTFPNPINTLTPKKIILIYIHRALILSKNTNGAHTIKRLLLYRPRGSVDNLVNYGFEFILFGIGETEKYMKKLKKKNKCGKQQLENKK